MNRWHAYVSKSDGAKGSSVSEERELHASSPYPNKADPKLTVVSTRQAGRRDSAENDTLWAYTQTTRRSRQVMNAARVAPQA